MIQGRLVELMSYFKLTAVALAENIGVQPSSVSHILSGRNKPSLDFVNKLLGCYPQVNFDWLVNGKGAMLKPETQAKTSANLFSQAFEPLEESEEGKSKLPIAEQRSDYSEPRITKPASKSEKSQPKSEPKSPKNTPQRQVSRIVIFYSDNTFEEFSPKND